MKIFRLIRWYWRQFFKPEQVEYVAGFLFTGDLKHIALIHKLRPEWQRGKLNGVGGHIEPGETALMAMNREWVEEANPTVHDWIKVCTLVNPKFIVYFFAANTGYKTNYFEPTNDERISWFKIEDSLFKKTISNLRWLIPMALDKDSVTAIVHDPS